MRRTNSLGTATRRLARTARGHRAAEVARASATSGWPAASSGCRSWSVSTHGRRPAGRHRAAGVVHEVEVLRSARASHVDSATTRRARDRPSIGAHLGRDGRHQLGVGVGEGRQHEQPQVEVGRRRGRASPRTVATVDCSLPPTSPGTSQSRLIADRGRRLTATASR